jgi:hypothetical protein
VYADGHPQRKLGGEARQRVLSEGEAFHKICPSDRPTLTLTPSCLGPFRLFTGQDLKEYLDREADNATEIGTLQFFSYLIVLANLVPISLYVR